MVFMRAMPVILRRKPRSLQEVFAKNVFLHRSRIGLTQDELAARCGYHRTYIGSVERGERNVTLATIEAFADVFGVPPAALLTPPP